MVAAEEIGRKVNLLNFGRMQRFALFRQKNSPLNRFVIQILTQHWAI